MACTSRPCSSRPSTSRPETCRTGEDYNLSPTYRNYIQNHPVSKLATLHSDERMIAPVWGKVTKTAW